MSGSSSVQQEKEILLQLLIMWPLVELNYQFTTSCVWKKQTALFGGKNQEPKIIRAFLFIRTERGQKIHFPLCSEPFQWGVSLSPSVLITVDWCVWKHTHRGEVGSERVVNGCKLLSCRDNSSAPVSLSSHTLRMGIWLLLIGLGGKGCASKLPLNKKASCLKAPSLRTRRSGSDQGAR